MLTNEEIILIRKSVKVLDFKTPYADTLAFAKAILEAVQKKIESKDEK